MHRHTFFPGSQQIFSPIILSCPLFLFPSTKLRICFLLPFPHLASSSKMSSLPQPSLPFHLERPSPFPLILSFHFQLPPLLPAVKNTSDRNSRERKKRSGLSLIPSHTPFGTAAATAAAARSTYCLQVAISAIPLLSLPPTLHNPAKERRMRERMRRLILVSLSFHPAPFSLPPTLACPHPTPTPPPLQRRVDLGRTNHPLPPSFPSSTPLRRQKGIGKKENSPPFHLLLPLPWVALQATLPRKWRPLIPRPSSSLPPSLPQYHHHLQTQTLPPLVLLPSFLWRRIDA